jgi:hypothetical protein
MVARRTALVAARSVGALGVLAAVAACGAPAAPPPAWDAVVDSGGGLWDTVPVTLTWAAPGDDAGAETFTIDLPPQLRPLAPTADATASDGTPVGTVVVDDGTARVTWEPTGAEAASAVVPMAWDPDRVTAGQDVTLTFRAGDELVRREASIRPDDAAPGDGRLYGYWTDRENEDRESRAGALQWRYVTPVGVPTDVHLTVDPGQELSCDDVTFRVLRDGEDGVPMPRSDAPEVDCSPHELRATLTPTSADRSVMLLVAASPLETAPRYTARADGLPGPLTSTIERVGAATPHGADVAAPTSPPWLPTAAGAGGAAAACGVLALAALRRRRRATAT